MSTRWMAVQFVGDTLRLPIVSKPDMDKPFGSSELEREVRRIVVNPFSDNPQTFIPEAENDKLRELAKDFLDVPCQCLRCEHYNYEEDRCDLRDRARELGIEEDR